MRLLVRSETERLLIGRDVGVGVGMGCVGARARGDTGTGLGEVGGTGTKEMERKNSVSKLTESESGWVRRTGVGGTGEETTAWA